MTVPSLTVPAHARTIIPGMAFHVPGFISVPPVATSMCMAIIEETYDRWVAQVTYGRGFPTRVDPGHAMARFGDPGVTYTYKGKPKPMYAMTPALAAARDWVAKEIGWRANCVVVNSYQPSSGLYPHRDGNYIPQLGDTPTIAALSFGCTRTFLLHLADPSTNKRVKGIAPASVQLGHGDLFVMHGECDRRFHHSIPEEPDRTGTRVSLTFRRHLS